jgi:hypothetical protein
MLLAACLAFATSARAAPRPLLGVTRWDMYSGDAAITQKQEFGFLKPEAYWWRAPFFVRRTGDPERPLAFNPDLSLDVLQAAMDQEIEFAASCGIDYWAFGFERSDRNWGLRYNLDAYLRSRLKGEIGFCVIANGPQVGNLQRWEPPDTVYDPAFVFDEWRGYVREFVALMREPGYQRVLGDRPLLYLYHPEGLARRLGDSGDWAPLAAAVAHLRETAQAAGVGNPYVVCMMEGDQHRALLQAGVADAVTLYHYRYGPVGRELPYRELWPAIRRDVLDRRFAGDNVPTVPPLMSGANWVPRVRVMPQIFPNWNWLEPEAGELGAHLAAGLDYVAEHPAKCPANTVLMYAWNEHSEGGFLCPLMGDPPDYAPNTRQIDEVSKTLAAWAPPGERARDGGILACFTFGDRVFTLQSAENAPDSAVSAFGVPFLAFSAPTTRGSDGVRGLCLAYHALPQTSPDAAFSVAVTPVDPTKRLELTALDLRLWRRQGSALRSLRVEPLGALDLGECAITGWDSLVIRPTAPVRVAGTATVRIVPEPTALADLRLDTVRLHGRVIE